MVICDNRSPSHSGILAGICKGYCWRNYDNTLAVTYSYCVGGCGVFGMINDPKEALDFFSNVFLDLKNMGIDCFEFSAEEDQLREDLLLLFQDKKINSELEYSYRLDRKVRKNQAVSDEYEIIKVDSALIERLHKEDIVNKEELFLRLENSWNSQKDFLTKSAAYVAICNRCLIGIIFGSARYENYVAIDIEVAEQYRRRGIAKQLAEVFIEECQNNDLIPQWDCVESNTASRKLAESLGFHLIKKRRYHWFSLT